MALDTAAARNAAVDGLKQLATHVALFSTAASGAAGTELTGVTRQAVTWSAASNGTVTGTVPAFTGFPAGSSIASFGLFTAATGGTYLTGGALSPTRSGLQPSDSVTVPVTLTVA